MSKGRNGGFMILTQTRQKKLTKKAESTLCEDISNQVKDKDDLHL